MCVTTLKWFRKKRVCVCGAFTRSRGWVGEKQRQRDRDRETASKSEHALAQRIKQTDKM